MKPARVERFLLMLLVFFSAVAAIVFWRKATLFQNENDKLRAEVNDLEQNLEASTNSSVALGVELEALRKQRNEVLSLRNEVTQLRSASKSNLVLLAENQRLKQEKNQFLSANAAAHQSGPKFAGQDHFGRDAWTFAGYASPEDALVSAIWAMKEGNPATYMESLSPQEQQRMSEIWKNKNEQEIASKHQSDVSEITGVRIMERKPGNAGEVLLSVYLEGKNQMHTIVMNQNGNEWKFGGFLRPPETAQPQLSAP
jgi:hypothetical protein